MKLEIFDRELNKDMPIHLRLVKDYGDVRLVVCDVDGLRREGGILLSITENGILQRHPGVNRIFGLTLDEEGKIKEKRENKGGKDEA